MDNGGFEISDRLIGPWYVYNPGNKVVTPGHGSKHAAKVKRYISQYTNICRAQKYSFSADYMISGPAPTRDTNVTVRLKAGQLDFIKLYRLTNSSGFNRFDKWNTVRGTLGAYSPDYAPYNAIQFAASVSARDEKMALHDTYTLYVDNFVVKPTKAIFETVGEDALINGGFESGALNPWLVSPQKHSYDVSDGIVHQGLTNGSNYSFRYHAPEYEFGGSTAYYGYDTGGFVLQQNFTAVPGRQYLLSFNYRAAFINQIVVAVFDAHDAPQGYDGVNYVPGEEIPRSHFAWTIFGLSEFRLYGMDGNGAPTNNKLASFSRVFQAMSHKSTLSLSFTGTGYGDRSIETVRIDNVSILALADGRNL